MPTYSRTGVVQLEEELNSVTGWAIVLRVPEAMADQGWKESPVVICILLSLDLSICLF